MQRSKILNITYSAPFIALIFVATTLIRVPMPYGYANFGDSFVLISGIILGPFYGAISSGFGSAFADLIAYPQYAPITFALKFLMPLCVYFTYTKLFKGKFVGMILGFLLAELIMVLGYFLFECIIYGVGGAILGVLGNSLQGVVGVVSSTVVISFIRKLKK